jgi:hypothetical protein
MARKHDFKESIKVYAAATTASTKTYTFPTNYKKIFGLMLIDGSNSVKLKQMLPRHSDKYFPYPEDDSEGLPWAYTVYGDNFDLIPIPDDAYTLWCRTSQWPDKATTTASLSFYTPDKDDIIVAGMTYRGFFYLQMFEDATLWKREYIDLLNRAIETDGDLPDWDPKGEGFNATAGRLPGEFWNNPFIMRG